MRRFTRNSRRIVFGSCVVLVLLGGFLVQPAGALAGFATSPGVPRVSEACTHGNHFDDTTLVG